MATINPTPITPLPIPVPTTQDPVNFDQRADAFLAALPTWGNQLNSMGAVTYTNANEAYSYSEIAKAARDVALQARDSATASASSATASAASALDSKNSATASAASALDSKNSATASAASALDSKNSATASATLAEQYRDEAMVFSSTQITGTSTTSISIGAGQKTLTTQSQKAFSIGQYLVVTSQSDFNNRFGGIVSSYNSTTGVLVIEVGEVNGSGTYSNWSIALSAKPGQSSDLTIVEVNANTTVVSGVYYILRGNYTLTLPIPSAITPSFKFGWGSVFGGSNFGAVNWNGNNVKGKAAGVMTLTSGKDSAIVQYGGNSTVGFVEV